MPDYGRVSDLVGLVNRVMDPIEFAQQLGTYGKDDRSRQYPLDDPAKLRKALNECWTKVHACERENRAKKQEIAELKAQLDGALKSVTRYKIVNHALTSFLTVLMWQGLKAIVAAYPR